MAKSDPAGTISKRADGAVWLKNPDQSASPWTQIRDGGPPGSQPAPVAGAGAAGTAGAAHPWAPDQLRYGLDGHLPDPTIHPMHVDKDTEGDIDSKPVLSWVDETGRARRSYTMAFHRHRALAHHAAIKETTPAAFRTAHAHLKTKMLTADSPRERDAAAAALIHVTGGHRIGSLLGMHAMHVATTLPHQGGEAPDSGEEEVELQKSATEEPTHEHRVHMVMPHPHGHLYPATHLDEGLAEHMRSRVTDRAGAGALFECGPEDVRAALDEAGLQGIEEHTVRHHAVMSMAADKLSKLPKVDMTQDFASGYQQLMAHLQAVSGEIGEHFGHDPAPQGMSYVPPPIAAAYVEESGGAKHWPLAFKSQTVQEVEKSVCTSPNEATRSSSAQSPTTSGRSAKRSTATPTTSRRQSRTPTPSQPSSPSRSPNQDSSQVEVSLAVEPVIVPVRVDDDGAVVHGARVEVGPARVAREEYPFTGHICFQGFDIDVENVAGSYREGTDAGGHKWRCLMHAHYGEFRKSEGVDGDKLDVYVGPYADSPLVVVVRQSDPATGKYDEDKVMVGFLSAEAAIETYKKQYDRAGFYGGSDAMSIGEFRRWRESRWTRGRRVEGGATFDPAPVPVVVEHSVTSEADARLRQQLHKTLGTQYPDERVSAWRRLAEKALGRAVAKVRDGTLAVDILKAAHERFLGGDHKGCYSVLSLAKSSGGAGSAGSTGSTGSTGGADNLKPIYSAGQTRGSTSQVNRGRHRIGSGGTGAHPGPDGLPIGSVTVLADGTREQKVGPHEWRRIGEGSHQPKAKEDTTQHNPTLDAALQELHRLRKRREVASSNDLKHELDEQIEAVRSRIMKLRQGLGKFKAAKAAKQEASQGRSADRSVRDQRESTHELAKSVRALAQLKASHVPVFDPWYRSHEAQCADALDDFIREHASVEEVKINLYKAAPQAHIAAQAIAAQLGPSGLDRYILTKIGG